MSKCQLYAKGKKIYPITKCENIIMEDGSNLNDSVSIINNTNIDCIKTKMIAHRGYNALAPENSIPAYELAGEYGFWGAETDVCETRDGEFILMHDDTIDRTTNGSGLVSNFTLAQLKEFIIDTGNNISNYPNLRIPSLDEFLETCKKCNLIPVIEIKTISDSNIDNFLNKIKSHGFINKTIIISFNYDLLKKIRSKNKAVTIQPLMELNVKNIELAKSLGANTHIDSLESTVTRENVELAHKQGLLVNVWTVNNINRLNELIELGVDFVTTDKLYDETTLKYSIKTVSEKVSTTANTITEFTMGTQSAKIGSTFDELMNKAVISNRCACNNKFVKSGDVVFISKPRGFKITLMPFGENETYLRDYGWFDNGERDISSHTDVKYYHLYFAKEDGSNFTNEDLKILKENVTVIFKSVNLNRKYNFVINDGCISQASGYTKDTCTISYDGDETKTFTLTHSEPINSSLKGISFANVSLSGSLNISIRTKSENKNGLKFALYNTNTNTLLSENEVLSLNWFYFSIVHMV